MMDSLPVRQQSHEEQHLVTELNKGHGANGHNTSNGHAATNGHVATNGHATKNGHAASNGHSKVVIYPVICYFLWIFFLKSCYFY